MEIPVESIERALLVERVRLHRAITVSSIGATAVAAVVTVWSLQGHAGTATLWRWVAVLVLTLGLRMAISLLHARDEDRERHSARWLLRYRLAFAAHGLAWAYLGMQVLPVVDHDGLDVLLFALTALTAGSLIATAFDFGAALTFAIPTLSPALLHLTALTSAASTGLVAAIGTFIAFTMMSAVRAHQLVLHSVKLRLAESAIADAARRHAAAAESTKEELAQQHHLMNQLMRNTLQGYWFIDQRGMTTDVNPAMCALLGRSREDIVGRSVFEFFSGDDLLTLHDEIERRRAGKTTGYEIGLRRPDGSRLPCFNHATPIIDIHGQQMGSVGLWTDLTPTRQTESTLRTYEVVANSITDAVSVIDEGGIYRLVNDAWCRMSGLPREQAIGQSGQALYPFVSSDERRIAHERCLSENTMQVVRSSLPGQDGRVFESSYFPYLGSGLRSVVVVTRDVTERDETQRAMRTSAEELRATLDATGDGIFASDATTPDEPVRFVNAQLLRMWNITDEAGSPLTAARIMAHAMPHFEEPEAESRRLADIVRSDLPHEARLTLRDGRVLLRRCVTSKIQGRTLRVWSFRDVTDAERSVQVLRESEAQVRRLLDAFPGYIAAIDRRDQYVYVNERLAQVLGGSPTQFVGRQVLDVLGPTPLRELAPEIALARTHGQSIVERICCSPHDQRSLDLEVTHVCGPGPAGSGDLVYFFGQDISARKRAEEALIAARDDAERANRAKSQFLSQMSHELRTPMNAIIGFGQLLECDPNQPLAGAQPGYVREILRGGRYLLTLINEVLDLGRIEAGRMQVDQNVVPVQPLIDACLNLVRPLALERGVQLPDAAAIVCTHSALADRMRLKQVLLNLLSNAIKYNRDGGRVGLDCHDDGSELVIEISDQGKGLTDEQQRLLFMPFERLDADRSGIEGTGIGLALSRRLIELMGGAIGIRSRPGAGSTFWIRLPLVVRTSESAALTGPFSTQTTMTGTLDMVHTVLYIEDNPVNTVLMEAMLSRVPGLRLITAALPRAGLDLARREAPSLILLDIQLPGMDGYEVLHHLRADHRTAGIPVVAVSANPIEGDMEAGRHAGFDAYLSKPLDMQELLETVRRLMGATADRQA